MTEPAIGHKKVNFVAQFTGLTFQPVHAADAQILPGNPIATTKTTTFEDKWQYSSEGAIALADHPNYIVSYPVAAPEEKADQIQQQKAIGATVPYPGTDLIPAGIPSAAGKGAQLVLNDVTVTRWKIVDGPVNKAASLTAIWIQSLSPVPKTNGTELPYVVDVYRKQQSNNTNCIAWPIKTYDPLNQLWTIIHTNSATPFKNCYIEAAMNGHVLTVDEATIHSAVPQLLNAPKAAQHTYQLWNFTPNGFIQLASSPNLVLALPVTGLGAPQSSVTNFEAYLTLRDLALSLWLPVAAAAPTNAGYDWYKVIHPRGLVIDVCASAPAVGTQVIGWPKKDEAASGNQLWKIGK